MKLQSPPASYRLLLPAALSLIALAGCATARPILVPPTITGFSGSSSPLIEPIIWNGQKVLVLPPKIDYKTASTEQRIHGSVPSQPWGSNVFSSPPLKSSSVSISLTAFANQSLSNRGFRAIEFNDPLIQNQPELREILSKWSQEPSELLRPWSKNRTQTVLELQAVKETLGVDAVLVQLMDVKVGAPGTWNAMVSGTVTSETSTSDLKTGLVDTASGKVVWKRHVFFRDVPDDKLLDRSLHALYGDFPMRKNEDPSGGA